MTDSEFQDWMKRLAGVDERAPAPEAGAIWWRAQLRQRIEAGQRATRPIRIAESAAGVVCLVVAAAVSVSMGAGGFAAFLVVIAAAIGGLRAIAPKRL